MEQVVSNREWGEMSGRVCNRWCRILYGEGCEVVYGTDGVESCIWDEMRGRVWNRWCGIVYGGGMRCRVWNIWCRIVYKG